MAHINRPEGIPGILGPMAFSLKTAAAQYFGRSSTALTQFTFARRPGNARSIRRARCTRAFPHCTGAPKPFVED